jgi:lysozyme family protein
MIDNWQKSFDLLLQSEGGYSDDPADPGGRTNLGVTQRVWESWVGRASNEKEMRNLTPADVAPLYKRKYWDACDCDLLTDGVDYVVFDFAVNAGVGRSVKTLQSCVDAAMDGQIGKNTLGLVATFPVDVVIFKFSDEKVGYYKQLPTFSEFGKGWLDRVDRVKKDALKMVG